MKPHSSVTAHAVQRRRLVTDNMLDLVSQVNVDMVYEYVSPSYKRILGYEPDDLVGTSALTLLHPKDAELAAEVLSNALARDGSSGERFEFRHLHAEGHYVWLEAAGSVLSNDDGETFGIVLSGRDITERKRTEKRLQSTLSLLRATLESTADGILVVDLEGRVVASNRRFQELWRLSDELVATGDDERMLAYAGDQLVDPTSFFTKVRELYSQPDADSRDILEFKDGRVLERVSRPQKIEGRSIGRVWSFSDITEQRRAERALSASERRFRAMIENGTEGIVLLGADGRLRYASPGSARIFGPYPSDPSRYYEAYQEDFQRLTREFLDVLQKPNTLMRSEARVRGHAGDWRWIDFTWCNLLDDPNVGAVVVNCHDITDRRLAEAALLAHARQQAAVVKLGNLALSGEGVGELMRAAVELVSHTLQLDLCELFEVSPRAHVAEWRAVNGWPDELVGQSLPLAPRESHVGFVLQAPGPVVIEDLLSENRFAVPDHLRSAGATTGALVNIRLPDGPFGLLAAYSRMPRVFSKDDLNFMQAICHVLAESVRSKRAEMASLQEAEVSSALAHVGREILTCIDAPRRLELLCRVTTEALGCDFSRTLLWNDDTQRFTSSTSFGETDEEVESFNLLELPMSLLMPTQVVERDGVVEVAEWELPPNSLHARFMRSRNTTYLLLLLLRRGNELIGAQVAGYRSRRERLNSTERRIASGIARLASLALINTQLFEELNRANLLKSEFVGTMSHELRTPLHIITGYQQLLLDGEFGDLTRDQEEILQRATRAALHLQRLVESVLDLSRLESRQVPVKVEEIVADDLVDELVRDAARTHDRAEVRLVARALAPTPPLRTDPLKLRMILTNLLGNALKFTEAGHVIVTSRPRESGIEFAVSDTGMGIEEEVRKVMFEPFRQGEAYSTRPSGGVGLGLYIVRHLVELLGGTIGVDSEPGKGSTFRVWIPPHP